jgi:predicted acylesterase/phospholipase RssA
VAEKDDHHTAEAPEMFTEASFPAKPSLECDIVMKGGITSGVIYPLAVCQLAQAYRLRSVGGASAGAIAAAAAAAAEVGRASLTRQGNDVAPGESRSLAVGFLGLAQFPTLLGQDQADGKSLLFHLFRPQPQTGRLFELLTGALDEAARLPRPTKPWHAIKLAGRLLIRAARRALRRAFLGMLPGLVLVALGLTGLIATLGPFGVVLSVVIILVGIVIGLLGLIISVLTAVVSDVRQLPSVGFGISSGMGETESELALTPWLLGRLHELAGRPVDGRPLTFGDLKEHDIELRVMTTNLSRAQPMAMPWDDDVFFFEPAEFQKLFGEDVVNAMVRNPPPLPSAPTKRRDREVLLIHAGTKRPFPRSENLPIIVATRMSLSFPLLISAVPLYAIDYGRKANQTYSKRIAEWRQANPQGSLEDHAKAVPAPEFDVNWFSDGGLTTNLPVQFFDSPLPTRPTFAIDLDRFSEEHGRSPDEWQNSYLPNVNRGGLLRRTARWGPQPLSQLISFGRSLIQTARTWVDEASLVMPGYRDRVVTVYTGADEGGLNLSMPTEVVTRLSIRGRFAAQRLVEQFGPGGKGWDNHRWLRFRAATAALSEWLAGFEEGYTSPAPTSYDAILAGEARQPSYPLTADRLAAARVRITELRTQIDEWATPPEDTFTDNRPKQPPVIRLVPRDPKLPVDS